MTGMRAVLCDARPGAGVRITEIDRPTAGPDEVLVRLEASAINPADRKIRDGLIRPRGGEQPWVLGWDLVGRVESGDGFAPGTRVIGMSAMASTGRGTWAEYVVLPATSLTAAPDDLDATRLAQLPLAGLTALQTVQDLAAQPGERIALVGAAGAVGGFVLALLTAQGVPVVPAVRDPASSPVAGAVARLDDRSFDAVVDAAGIDATAAVRPGGRYVEVVPGTPAEYLDARATSTVVRVAESGEKLARLLALVAAGTLTLPAPQVFPLSAIDDAFTAFGQRRGSRVVLVADAPAGP